MKSVVLNISANVSQAMSSLNSLKGASSRISEGFKGVGTQISNAGDKMIGLAGNLGGLSLAFAPVVAGAGASVKTFVNFDDAMRQVQATMGGTESDYKKLESAAREMGRTTRFSATESAEALNYLALAGYDTDKAIATLPKVLSLASAGNMDLAKASDLVTDSMSILNVSLDEADGFIDKMAKTSQKSNTNVEQLGEAYLTAGGNINVLNGGVDEANVLLGVLADNGFKGSEGGTKLRNVIQSLTSPTSQASKTLEELGVSVADADGNMRTMPDIVEDLNSSLDGMGDVAKADTLNKIFNRADISAVNSLLDTSSERYSELADHMLTAEGTAQQMSDTLESGLGGSFRELKSMIEDLAISIGQELAPYIEIGVEKFKEFIDAIQPFMPIISKVIGAIALVGGALLTLSPIFLVVGGIFKFLGIILTKVGGLFKILGVVISAIGLPATILIAVIGVVIAIIWIFRDKIMEIFGAIVDFFAEWGSKIWNKMVEIWNGLIEILSDFFSPIWEAIVGVWEQIATALEPVVTLIFDIIVGIWNLIVPIIQTAMAIVWDVIVIVWNIIVTVITTVMNIIWTVIQTVWNIIVTVISVALNVIMTVISTVWNVIYTVISTVLNIILTVVTTVWNVIKTVITTIVNVIKSVITNVWNAIKSVITAVVNAIKTNISNSFNVIKSIIDSVMNAIKSIIDAIWSGIKSFISGVIDTIVGFFDKFNSLKETVGNAFNAVKDAVMTPLNSMKDFVSGIVDWVSDKLGSIGSVIGKLNPFTNGAFGGRTAMEFSTFSSSDMNLRSGIMPLNGGIQGFNGGSLGNLGSLSTSTQFSQETDNSVNIQNLTINARSQNPKEIEKMLLKLSKRSGK